MLTLQQRVGIEIFTFTDQADRWRFWLDVKDYQNFKIGVLGIFNIIIMFGAFLGFILGISPDDNYYTDKTFKRDKARINRIKHPYWITLVFIITLFLGILILGIGRSK